jgi:hypothetical protein
VRLWSEVASWRVLVAGLGVCTRTLDGPPRGQGGSCRSLLGRSAGAGLGDGLGAGASAVGPGARAEVGQQAHQAAHGRVVQV